MATRYGCQHLSDDELLRGFEGCRLAPGSFHHGDHVRLTWICLRRFGPFGAEEYLLRGIRKMAESAGVPEKFLYTMTVAWVRLVAARQPDRAPDEMFDLWINRHPELLDVTLLSQYYSESTLKSEAARVAWIEPDLRPLA
jgi:hypothetical protein